MSRLLIACSMFFLLCGCGQTGPLYLPEDEPVPAPPDVVNEQPVNAPAVNEDAGAK